MKTPEQIAKDITDEYAIALDAMPEEYWPMLVAAIEADRAQRQTDAAEAKNGS